MLTMAEIQEHLGRLSYRPGWTIEAYQGMYEYAHLVIRANVEDSYHPGQVVVLDVHSMLPPVLTVEELERWLLWRLSRIEIHECREWFKRDGKPVSDPHGQGADQDRPLPLDHSLRLV